MDRHQNSLAKTPLNSVAGQRHSKSKSYQMSCRSCLGGASRFGVTPALTARRHNTTRKAAKLHNITEKVNPEQLALLLKKEWQLSYVTPLHQFKHTQLKSYSRRLAAFVTAEKQVGVAVEAAAPQSSYKASFSVVQGLAETDDDAETIYIEIQSKPLFARHDESLRTVWSGWLTCINANPEYVRSFSGEFVCLPVFASNGAEPFSSLVKVWFQQIFDCCFGPLEISNMNLQWLVALWINCHPEVNIKHLKLDWTFPVAPPLEVAYTVHPQAAWKLWSSVRKDPKDRREEEEEDEDEGSIYIEEVMSFMQGLKTHFYRHFRLDLSAASLNQVATAAASAKHSGRIKISSSRYMITTLTLLTECALLKMPI
ncbi:centromere protein L [Thalassophryne amazonica]|uniref:centromere protein L n=1 Tax=Thalassophryne amazonica TaxID=390379 RepID=UPI0014711AC1|nr:centromere protein L [Thalassophryne amazonica]